MSISKAKFIEMSEVLIEGRKNNPGWLYNSGVVTGSQYSVRFLNKKEEENGDIDINEDGSISCVFNTNTVFEDGSVSFDVFSEVFLKATRNNPKSYFELVPIVLRRETGYSYHQKRDDDSPVSKNDNGKRRWEEHEERAFYNYFRSFPSDLSENSISVIDYEMPLKVATGRPERLKGVDVVGLSSNNNIVYLLEMKNVGSMETLVRSSLEIYTYYSRLGLNRTETRSGVIKRIKDDYGPVFKDVSDIKPGVLLINGSNQHKVYVDMMKGDTRYRNLKRLMENLKLDVFVVNKYKGETVIPFESENDVINYEEIKNNKTKVKPVVKLTAGEYIRIEKAN